MKQKMLISSCAGIAFVVSLLATVGCEINVASEGNKDSKNDNSNQGNMVVTNWPTSSNLVEGVWIVTPSDEQLENTPNWVIVPQEGGAL